ncbi:chemotaxis protein CheW [Leptolyngbya sp. FACHB-261]|uniref:chemotaxis protein CheW n=1 Tax=Leptolyngbya sp. FACHB-261 TaxID=2692806 RepID=UPI00168A3400|nr:chemotaxis protein CheW [Leptolyngbya sp. FACHB-261]MBD2100631.1 chemotaxis protein CheW [Leptolyngbya sp. FACHB-261]
MSNNTLTEQHSLRVSSRGQAEPMLKVTAFSIGNLNLALPIVSIYKVLNHTQVHGSGLNSVGIAYIEERELTVVDLHRRLLGTGAPTQARYLIVIQNQIQELYGIPVLEIPVLMEVPLSRIRVLPESYRRADTLSIASHVALIHQMDAALTLFLLDVEQILPQAF